MTPNSKAAVNDKSDAITYKDPGTVNSMDEMLSSVSEDSDQEEQRVLSDGQRLQTPEAKRNKQGAKNRKLIINEMENNQNQDSSWQR